MHHSLLGAGRTTHLKIVALSLAGAIAVVLIGLNARLDRQCKHRPGCQSGTAGDACRTGELVNPLTAFLQVVLAGAIGILRSQ